MTSYGYDNVSRLTQLVQNPSGTSYDLTLDFSYDPAGGIASTTRSNDAYAWTGHYAVNRSYTANGLNQYTASGSISPTYDFSAIQKRPRNPPASHGREFRGRPAL